MLRKYPILLIGLTAFVLACDGDDGAVLSNEPPPSADESPSDDTSTPPDDTSTPPDDTSTPPDDTSTPPDDKPTPPDDKPTPPDDKPTPPDDKPTPPDDKPTSPDEPEAGTISLNDSVPGWASQEGGTTGGGTDVTSATLVTDQTEFEAALAGSGLILIQPGNYEIGDPTDPDFGGIRLQSNTSIIGTAPGVILHGNLRIQTQNDEPVSNVILRNFELRGRPCELEDCEGRPVCDAFEACRRGEDALIIRDGAHHIWIDHVDIVDGQDGNLDATQGADFITASWCQFRYTTNDKPHAFSNLIAGSDNEEASVGKLRITYMNSWWGDGVTERMPRGRFGKVHVFNNYYSSQVADYLIGPGVDIQMIIENNFTEIAPADPDDPAVFINDGFDNDPENRPSAYRATGNEGNAVGPLNKEKGDDIFDIPYDYELVLASEVKAAVTSELCGAGSRCTLATE
ncbi:MAG: hypothetical protein KTR25_17400 [Myxococcales bacterium]|nr:hypothetical protein [Myxococcales bacterium]